MIIITGPARSGTTFLIALLTRLGLDTGINDRMLIRKMWNNEGGLEYLRDRNTRVFYRLDNSLPRIIKHPFLIDKNEKVGTIFDIAESEGWDIEHVFFTRRDLEANIQSQVARMIKKKYGSASLYTEENKEEKLELHRTMLPAIIAREMKKAEKYKVTYLDFPRFVLDADYLFNSLHPILEGITREKFMATFRSLAKVEHVHFK